MQEPKLAKCLLRYPASLLVNYNETENIWLSGIHSLPTLLVQLKNFTDSPEVFRGSG